MPLLTYGGVYAARRDRNSFISKPWKLVLPTEEGEAADDVLDAPEQCDILQERSRSHCSYDRRDCDSMVARQAICGWCRAINLAQRDLIISSP